MFQAAAKWWILQLLFAPDGFCGCASLSEKHFFLKYTVLSQMFRKLLSRNKDRAAEERSNLLWKIILIILAIMRIRTILRTIWVLCRTPKQQKKERMQNIPFRAAPELRVLFTLTVM